MDAAIGTIILLNLYFLPLMVAGLRGRQVAMVAVINVFLGWTIIGWVVALAIAVSDRGRDRLPLSS